MFPFVIGIVVGAAITLLAVIVIAPSRRVRAEPSLPLETQLKLLLGMDPDAPAPTLNSPTLDTPGLDTSALPNDWTFNTSQIETLRNLDGPTGTDPEH